MVSSLDQRLTAELQQRREQHLYRTRRRVSTAQGPEMVIDGKSCLSFCSNDYLGLASHPEIIKAMQQGAEQYGAGSGASHLVNGHTQAHHALELELAEFVQRPRALLFSTGYMANLGVVTALIGKGDVLLEDRLNHASLIDAGLLSGARLQRYLHADPQSLAGHLQKYPSQDSRTGNCLVMTDGVFSMDGDIAPLPALTQITTPQQAWLMVDDAHGFGVLGNNGRGTLEHFHLDQEAVPVLMCTLGKALGTFGAFVAGSEALIETLIQRARSYIYTTALPAALAEATRASLRLIQTETWRREKLQALIKRFKSGATQLGLNLLPSDTAIQALLLQESDRALQVSEMLWHDGIFISAIRPPTVPPGTARLRITLSAAHSEQHIDRLLASLERLA